MKIKTESKTALIIETEYDGTYIDVALRTRGVEIAVYTDNSAILSREELSKLVEWLQERLAETP